MSATGGRSTSGPGAAASSNAVSLKPIEVPQALQSGEKFIKWDEVLFCFEIYFAAVPADPVMRPSKCPIGTRMSLMRLESVNNEIVPIVCR